MGVGVHGRRRGAAARRRALLVKPTKAAVRAPLAGAKRESGTERLLSGLLEGHSTAQEAPLAPCGPVRGMAGPWQGASTTNRLPTAPLPLASLTLRWRPPPLLAGLEGSAHFGGAQ